MSSPMSFDSSMSRSGRRPPSNHYQQQHQQPQQQSPRQRLGPPQTLQASGKHAVEELLSTQMTLRRDVMRHDESVQAVRQENIMLAEKVQQSTSLYRQLLSEFILFFIENKETVSSLFIA